MVPSLGTSPYLRDCLESAASSRGVRAEIVLVQPVSSATTPGSYPTVRQVVTPTEVGFSEACNRGLEQSYSEFVALLNDDAVVEPDWADQLIAALAAVPRAAAAQGVNLRMACPERMDGRGLAWNRSWQAIQIGHGDAPPDVRSPVEEVFGVSATAAVYRRAALLEAAVDSRIFDPRLESYYEDVDLACRLRTAGYSALSVPAARAFHVGGATTGRQPVHRASLIYGNRYLVLARAQGRAFWPLLPALLGRDLRDLVGAALEIDYPRGVGIMAGWARAARNLRFFAHRGDPRAQIRRAGPPGEESKA